MTYSVEDSIEDKIQVEQSIFAEFSVLKKTMRSIVFLGCGSENSADKNIKIRAANLSLLDYFLWKILEETNRIRNTKDFNAVKMFLTPVLKGSWETEKNIEYASVIKDPFDIFRDAAYDDVVSFHNDFYKELGGITRDHASQAIKVVNLTEIQSIYNLQRTYKILSDSQKAERANQKLIVILIIISFLGRESFEEEPSINYSGSMSILIRLGLLLYNSFIEELESHTVLLAPVQEAIVDFKNLNRNDLKGVIDFLFKDIVKGDSKTMSFIEKDIFRITQRLFRLAYGDEKKKNIVWIKNGTSGSNEEMDYKKWLSKVLRLLFYVSAEEINYKLGYDEENFYFLLKRGMS